ncbi:MAG: hypothetical protein PF961_06685, partial [Planctomycetota bacterium]|nr:hypothetical protein [Planctomycetota bacterium]
MPDDPQQINRFTCTQRVERFGKGRWFEAQDDAGLSGFLARSIPAEFGHLSVDEVIAAAEPCLALDHDRVLRLHLAERVQDDKVAIVTDPYDDLRNLDRVVLPRCPLNEREALSILREIVDGIEAIDGLPHAHGWLTPTQIFFDDDSHVVIANPWVGWVEDLLGQMKTSGTTEWSYTFASPETMNAADTVDLASDLFSAVAIFFTMITGEPPFDSNTALIVSPDLPIPTPEVRTHRADASDAAVAILQHGLQFERDARYTSADDLRADIDAALRRQPLPIAPMPQEPEPEPVAKPSTAPVSGDIPGRRRARGSDELNPHRGNRARSPHAGAEDRNKRKALMIGAGAAAAVLILVIIGLVAAPDTT